MLFNVNNRTEIGSSRWRFFIFVLMKVLTKYQSRNLPSQPSLNTQSCIKRPSYSTLKFENLRSSVLAYIEAKKIEKKN